MEKRFEELERHEPDSFRRRVVLASLSLPFLPALVGCAAPLQRLRVAGTTREGHELLMQSAAAHGLDAFQKLSDLSVSYEGKWGWLAGKLQPILVDAGFRGGLQERLLQREGVVAQGYTGPSGHKQVVRHTAKGAQGDVRVWFNGEEAYDLERRAAAALVVDGYSLFLLGPMLLAQRWSNERVLELELTGTERLTIGGHSYTCDVLRLRMTPGLGLSIADELAVFIDREERLMRRVRFTLDGLESTRGAIAEVDTVEHVKLHGIRWPTRFHERLLRPVPLSVHQWQMSGLDVNRGLTLDEVSAATFAGKAEAPAAFAKIG
ncbi:MAG: hypothetical protein M3O26_16675 [Pseudomonadota bacterium]|nr:hypothetical protein [Pseudomonadota bacterium]